MWSNRWWKKNSLEGEEDEVVNAPWPRMGHTTNLLPEEQGLIMYGGWNGETVLNDTWRLELGYKNKIKWK